MINVSKRGGFSDRNSIKPEKTEMQNKEFDERTRVQLINMINRLYIFTSHNLRPLETIDKGFIAFTTTNPDNRYVRMAHVKTNNNLRDYYFRDIVLGEQKEELYNPTNNYRIALAFREAGEGFDTVSTHIAKEHSCNSETPQ